MIGLLLVGCRGGGGPSNPMGGGTGHHETHGHEDTEADTTAGDESSADETGTGGQAEHHFDLPGTVAVNDGSFATSPVCAECHSNADGAQAMRDELGEPIAPDDLWQGTMMANSARDPFWWAMVRAETIALPSLAAEIEAECTRCHAPMASIREDLYGGPLALDDLLDGGDDRAQLGLDGVSCAGCHQVPAGDALGPPPLPADGRIYGPHADPFTMPMQMHTGFTPTASSHTDESALCGTCHTLRTEGHAADGTPLGMIFSEQAPYLEWRNSVFSTEGAAPGGEAQSCQGCHMPSRSEAGADLSTRIARRPMGDDFPPIGDRWPYHRHQLVGGNTLVMGMLRDFADELRPRGSSEAFEASIDAARTMLQGRTATIAIVGPTREGDALVLPVRVENLAGHKLPTGIPSRRAILRLTVRDASGSVVFVSGATDDEGRLIDGSGEVLAAELPGGEPSLHRTMIDAEDQVQLYQSVLADETGAPTFRLLRASAYLGDNRLLPQGWTSDGPHASETAPVLGGPDDDFVAGSDTVEYRVLAPASDGPYAVEAELLYQPIGARFAAELLALDAPEIRAFERMWEASDRSPEPIAAAAVELP